MKYRIEFSGYAYVEANSEKEAEEKFYEGDSYYSEHLVDNVEEVYWFYEWDTRL